MAQCSIRLHVFYVQGEFVEQAEKARVRAQRSGGVFQEKFEELKQA